MSESVSKPVSERDSVHPLTDLPTHPPTVPKVLLFHGRGVISSLIRWQTRGQYSHAAFLLPDGQILESWQGDGVRLKTLSDYRGIDVYEIPGMTPAQWAIAIEWALAQVGKKYDYWSIIRFVSRRKLPANDKLFCSELLFAACALAGYNLFERIEASAVSPSLLAITPLIRLSAVQTFARGPLTAPGAETKPAVT